MVDIAKLYSFKSFTPESEFGVPTEGSGAREVQFISPDGSVIQTGSSVYDNAQRKITVPVKAAASSAGKALISVYTSNVNLSAGQVVALDPANAGKVILCDASSGSTNPVALGVVETGGIAGANIYVTTWGELTLSLTPFALADIGKNIYVNPAVAGAFTLIEPTVLGQRSILVGTVLDLNKINVQGNSASNPV